MRPDMKRGPKPVQPGQRMPSQMRPQQRPHFSGAAGPSRQSMPPGPSRPSMPMGLKPGVPGRTEGAPIRAVHSPATRAPSNPARPQGLKPIRGLPIGASVKIKTNVKTSQANKQPPVIVKPDQGKCESSNDQKPSETPNVSSPVVQQNGEQGSSKAPSEAAPLQPQKADSSQRNESSKSSTGSNVVKSAEQEEVAPTENPPVAKE